MAKKKHQGHYCKVCGVIKSNESFSGKGHKNHICKKCAQLPEEVRQRMMCENAMPFSSIEEIDDKLVLLEEDVDYMDFDAIPPKTYDSIRYTKLNNGEKTFFRQIVQTLVIEFWDSKRQIPDGGEVNQIMNTATRRFEERINSSIKNDKDLRRIVQSMIVPTINKQLRRENRKANEG